MKTVIKRLSGMLIVLGITVKAEGSDSTAESSAGRPGSQAEESARVPKWSGAREKGTWSKWPSDVAGGE